MMTLTRWIVRATLPLTLVLAACDSDAPVEDRAEVEEASVTADEAAAAHGKRGMPWERLCAVAECSDAQADQVAALFKANRAERRGERPDPDAFKAENAALAAKVRDGRLSAADLEAHRQAIHAAKAGEGKRPAMGAMLVGLHKILTPEQRGVLADTFMSGHGMGMLGMHGMGGHHEKFGGWDHDGDGKHGMHGKRGKHDRKGKDGADGKGHGQHKMKGLGKLCKIAECSDAQREAIQELAMKSREAGKAGHEQAKATRQAAGQALADAFRGEAFDQGAVDRFHATMEPLHAARMQAMEQLVVDALAVLDDAQRAKIATKVEEKGARALMPHKGKKKGKHGMKGERGEHGKRGKHGKHGKPGHERVSDDVPA